MKIDEIEKELGLVFNDKNLIRKAFTHTSYAYENKMQSNEKLEFLGDAILEFVVSKYLYNNYKNLTEGEMTKVRAAVVCENSLLNIAKKHNFSDFLYVGKSEQLTSGNKRPAVLADSVEAVIAAIFLDLSLEKAEEFIIENLKDAIKTASANVGKKDYKTVLQEKLQVNGDVSIKYTVIKEEGPDHNKVFTVQLTCNDKLLSVGEGSSKKNAEMQAAKVALEKIKR